MNIKTKNYMKSNIPRKKLLIFIVAYKAERTIENVISRIPINLMNQFETEVLIIDDSSDDSTFDRSQNIKEKKIYPFRMTVLYNPINMGYGGNQKIGYHYAINNEYDFVVLLHGDGQYAPELLPEILLPLNNDEADLVLGSRMMKKGGARKGGMPLYKFIGNKILTIIQNYLLNENLSEFHSGYRAYSVSSLNKVPFHLNSNDYHFDSEIIIQLFIAKMRIKEVPIPTYYGDEISYVNGFAYAYNVLKTTIHSRFQELGIFYNRKYDCKSAINQYSRYQPKLNFPSPHTFSVQHINKAGAKIVDAGSSEGYMTMHLKEKGYEVISMDLFEPDSSFSTNDYIQHDLNKNKWPIMLDEYDYLLLLDVIEHLVSPEKFIDNLRTNLENTRKIRIHASTGNIGFIITRLMLVLGQFNYGKRGILDLTHTRLFTFNSFRRLFEQAGFDVLEVQGVPAPFPFVLGDKWMSHLLIKINQLMIKLSKSLFSYQIFLVARPRPSLNYLLRTAQHNAEVRTVHNR
tara:strand:- start:183 stop:1727 length:1545 start_codon:yes stop_codon:yes gene_type:complete